MTRLILLGASIILPTLLLGMSMTVRIIKHEDLSLEIVIFGIKLRYVKKERNRDNGQTRQNKMRPLSPIYNRAVISAIPRIIRYSKLRITSIEIPITEDPASLYKPHMGLYTALSYLDSICLGLKIEDNAFILSPDINKLYFDFSISITLFRLAKVAISTSYCLIKNKLRRKIKYVGK